MRVADATWEQIQEYLQHDDRCVVPLGSTEQHAYISLATDSILSERVALEAADPVGVPVFPAVAYGVTPYFMGYPGTVTLSLATYEAVLIDVLVSLRRHGFRRVLLVNGHGGNGAASDVVARWAEERSDMSVRWHDWWSAPKTRAAIDAIDPGASHASWMETFPWTRVAGVELPDGYKDPVELGDRVELSPDRVRERAGDGSYGGFYERPEEELVHIWEVAVAETRARLTDGW